MAILRVMTWNVQNFLPVGFAGGPKTTAEFDAMVASLAAVIDEAKPDVLGLQEVGPPAVLDALQSKLTHKLARRAVSDLQDGREIRVAFLSRLTITARAQIHAIAPGLSPVQIADIGPRPEDAVMTALKRGALEVTVDAAGESVTLLVAHLKSKLLSYPGGRFAPRDEGERARVGGYALNRRTAEAVTMRDRLNTTLAGQGLRKAAICLGDLNDEVEAATTQILNGPGGSEIGTVGFDRPDGDDANRMWNLAPLIPEAERFSRVYRGRRELIDHIFASRRMLDILPSVSTIAAQPGQLPSITDDPRAEHGKPGSDHSAVLAVFTLN